MSNKFTVQVQEQILDSELSDELKDIINSEINRLKSEEINILVLGSTGVGKSSTINAIFDSDIAPVGLGVEPETFSISSYKINNIVLWDTPGLGDNPENDNKYATEINKLLKKQDLNGCGLIDLVLIVLDASSRDLGTTFELLKSVILPNIEDSRRIIIGLNQCDFAMKGRYWDKLNNKPESELVKTLESKVESIKERLYESSNIKVNPIIYSALYKYNLSKLLYNILSKVPETKRLVIADNINTNPEVWQNNDTLYNYNSSIRESIELSLINAIKTAKTGALIGAKIGKAIPIVGPIIGSAVGGVLGFLSGLIVV